MRDHRKRTVKTESEETMFYSTEYPSPIGQLTIASDGIHIVGLWLKGQKYFLGTLPEIPVRKDDLEVFDQVRNWLDRYFAKQQPDPKALPLKPIGGAFRQAVWECLCQIPYGEVTTYGALAKKAAEKLGRETMSAQAVGGAVGHNPISILIPCHRVIGANGSLTGYAGGIDKKIQLLALEGADTKRFYIPKQSSAM